MTPDEMANFHEHMAEWCDVVADEQLGWLVAAAMKEVAEPHREAFQYWCRQANSGKVRNS